jgi:Uncharacterized protein conserved in bacteria
MDRFEISTLRSYYGALLTQRQNDMLVMHYDEDLSFGEIANIVGISRQAVLDGINKGEKHLCEYEQKLRLVEKDRKMHAVIDTLAGVDDDRAKQCAQQLRLLLEE